jgi:tRNA U34 5-carboxymethylaminomethyl modifying GTPase MnmE/TrmE
VLRLQKDFLFPTANAAITIVRVSGKRRVLSVLNDIGQYEEIMRQYPL